MPDADSAVLLVAGGRGVRFGSGDGKQLATAAGRPVLGYSLAACLGVDRVGLVVVVCDPARVEEYANAVADVAGSAEVRFVPGGERRQDSVAAGLAEVPEGAYRYLVVHDGARPLVRPSTFEIALGVLDERPEVDGVVAGHPSFDTLKVVDGDRITETPDRARYWVAQTPQAFREQVLRSAYAEARRAGYEGTDDSSLVEAQGAHVTLVEGPRDNIKVTLASDLTLVEAALAMRDGEGAR